MHRPYFPFLLYINSFTRTCEGARTYTAVISIHSWQCKCAVWGCMGLYILTMIVDGNFWGILNKISAPDASDAALEAAARTFLLP